ncbi:MAG: TldD/PmbA family protein [Acidimicrobiales bacterium]
MNGPGPLSGAGSAASPQVDGQADLRASVAKASPGPMAAGREAVDLDAVAQAVLGRVARRAVGAEAEVTVSRGHRGLTRFANSHIHQNVAESDAAVRLRVFHDGRHASANVTIGVGAAELAPGSTTADGETLDRLVERVMEMARLRPVDEAWPGLAPPTPPVTSVHVDPALAGGDDPMVRARMVADFVAAGGGGLGPASPSGAPERMVAAGFASTSFEQVVFANSVGACQGGAFSDAVVEGIFRGATSAGRGYGRSPLLCRVEAGAAGTVAATKATAGRDPRVLAPGSYPVVLEPLAVSDLLSFWAWYGFNAKAHAEGQSFVEVGGQQFDPVVTVVDDPFDPLTQGMAFDAEGTPRSALDLVRNGVCVGMAHDRRTAASAAGPAASTGHAVVGGEVWGPMCSNLVMAAGTSSPEALMAKIGSGLLVTELWYTRVLDPKTQVVTGLTRSGLFWFDDGQVSHPVADLRFTQSYVEALGPGSVVGVGDDPVLTPSGVVAPSLALASWNFTGDASG